MSRKTNDSGPPKVMTWGKATPALVISVISDALRLMFVGFIFFGPAMAGLYCTSTTSGWVGSLGGLTTAACTAGAVALGFYGFVPAATFGTVMAMAVGLLGWLVVGGWLWAKNSRIFKENTLWFVGSLLFSEMPFIGAIPAITASVWKMHSNQIKIEKAVFAKWKKENAERQRQAAQQAQLMQAKAMQQQAANDATYNQIQAANDEKYNGEEIPEEVRKAA
ncbi:MAG: hypothetical protein AAB831_01520 [Patescibacteria group bacterium]